MAVASPSVSGLVAIMTSSTSPVATRVRSSRIRMLSGADVIQGRDDAMQYMVHP